MILQKIFQMIFDVSAELNYSVGEASTVMLNIHAHKKNQNIIRESFYVDPYFFYDEISSAAEGNRLIRISIPGAVYNIRFSYQATVETRYVMLDFSHDLPTPLTILPPALFTYLHPSRYCQSDKLFRFANHQFGKIDNDFRKVLAIADWIHTNVEYLSGSTDAETSAYDTVTQQAGVCRDFAHLGIALCRALTIPARYCSVYSFQLEPQDFHACFEAYIAGRWVIFDATKLAPLNGLVRIATGRDAADTAISNLFGNVQGNAIMVNSLLSQGVIDPVYYKPDQAQGLCYYW